MNVSFERMARAAAACACACVLTMLALFLTTGIGQESLQHVHPATEYTRLLLANPGALRATLGMDNLFIVLYATVFFALGQLLVRCGASRALVLTANAFMLGTVMLDLVENMHFAVMLSRAEAGLLPTDGEIELQVVESLLKFHVSYVGLFLFGFAFPRSERWLSRLSWYVQLPVGVGIYVVPPSLATPLVLIRFAYFVTALVIVATRIAAPADASGSGARA